MNKEEREKIMKHAIHPSPVYIDGKISWNILINIDLETEKEALEYAKLLVKTTPLPIVPQTKLYDWWKKFRD